MPSWLQAVLETEDTLNVVVIDEDGLVQTSCSHLSNLPETFPVPRGHIAPPIHDDDVARAKGSRRYRRE